MQISQVLKQSYRPVTFCLSLFFILLSTSSAVHSQTASDPTNLPPDVRLIIDVSGSMKQNDPENLRQPAVDLLIKLLPEGSKAGVWTFGQWVNMLVPHRDVSAEWSKEAAAKASDIKSTGLFTNIGEALEKAAYDLDNPSDQYRTSIILLTDGMVDISKDSEVNRKEWRRIVDEVIPRLKDAGYTVHTIALSDNADRALMDKLALATDGVAAVAKNADDLMKAFLQAFNKAAPAEAVPLEGNRFVVDSSVEEFTALIFRQGNELETELVGPDDTIYRQSDKNADANWYHTDTYDLITVQQPLEGEWRVRGDMAPDSRVTVVSNLKLLVKPLPNNIYRGDRLPISLLLQEDGKTINRAEFLRLLDIRVSGDYLDTPLENAKDWQKVLSDQLVPGNGIYNTTAEWFDLEGEYRINVLVDGKTFKREFTHTLSVREAFGLEMEKRIDGGQTDYVFTVSSYSPETNLADVRVVAKIKKPNGTSFIESFTLTERDNWELVLTPEEAGQYVLSVRVSGKDVKGDRFDFIPEPKIFTYPDGDDPFNVHQEPPKPEPIVKAEPPKEAPKAEPPASDPEPEETVAPEPEPEPAPVQESSSKNWLLYSLLGLGNLLIVGLAYFAYRMIMGDKKSLDDEVSDDDEQDSETVASEEPTAQEADEPPMDEIPQDGDVSADDEMAAMLMDTESEDIDLSTDDALVADVDLDTTGSSEETIETPEEDEDEMPEFSLDDFEPMGLDGLDDDEDDDKGKQ